MPLSLGFGLKIDDEYNAVLLCKKCNNKKSNLIPTKFYTNSQLKELVSTYGIKTHLEEFKKKHKLLDIENLVNIYEHTIEENYQIYLDYLKFLWNMEKISKYRLKKGNTYKIYYLKDRGINVKIGKIKYNFLFGTIYINNFKIKLTDIRGVVKWV
jgi:hypothetical protein